MAGRVARRACICRPAYIIAFRQAAERRSGTTPQNNMEREARADNLAEGVGDELAPASLRLYVENPFDSKLFRPLCVTLNRHLSLTTSGKGGVQGGVEMTRNLQKLSDTKVRSEKLKPGRYSDGGGLYLVVTAKGGKSWGFLWKKPGAKWNTEMGLGSYPDTSLAKARDKAQACRSQLADGLDPIAERKKEAEPTFGECADKLVASMSPSWRNAKHRAQWTMTLTEYCKAIRDKKVSLVGTDDVLSVLKPIWLEKPETASRLRGRIERVLNFAKAKAWRSGENPAIWRGHLKDLLPAPAKLSRGHHAAMPYKEVPVYVARLRASQALAARALEFTILTAARTGEVLGMELPEIDFAAKVWTVPPSRMKANREHRVPLTTRAVEILTELRQDNSSRYMFSVDGSEDSVALSNMSMAMLMRRMKVDAYTVHGFRSAFRDWAGDETSFAREVAEAALAHEVGNATEQSYRRSDALAKRRKLMDAWAGFCASKPAGKVLQMFTAKN